MWLISNACEGLIDAIPQAIYDEDGKNDEDIKKTDTASDDILDEWRYGLKTMLNPRNKPPEVQLKEILDVIPDNTMKHLAHLKFISQKRGMRTFKLKR